MTDDARNPFEKTGGGPPTKDPGGRSKIPVGVLLALALVALIAGGVILFLSASSGTTPATGSTTSGIVTGSVVTGPVTPLLVG